MQNEIDMVMAACNILASDLGLQEIIRNEQDIQQGTPLTYSTPFFS